MSRLDWRTDWGQLTKRIEARHAIGFDDMLRSSILLASVAFVLSIPVCSAEEADVVSSDIPGTAVTEIIRPNETPANSRSDVMVYLGEETPSPALQEIINQCNAGGRVFVHEQGNKPLACRLSTQEKPAYGVILKGYTGKPNIITISTHPFAKPAWTVTSPDISERRALYDVARRWASAYITHLGDTEALKQSIIQREKLEKKITFGGQTFYIVQAVSWYVDGIDFSGTCWYSAIFKKTSNGPKFLDSFFGIVKDIVDVDGDHLPELRVEDCDFHAETAYYRLVPAKMKVMSWENPND